MGNNIRGDHICFLVGAGISPTGFPGPKEITEFIFDCEWCYRHTDGRYVCAPYPGNRSKRYTEPVSIKAENLFLDKYWEEDEKRKRNAKE